MKFESEIGDVLHDASSAELSAALSELGAGNSFAIMGESPERYIQAAMDQTTGLCVLEYRNGSQREHYRAMREDLAVDEVIRAFQSYAADESRWRKMFEWKRAVL